jgi:hypothetical protein
MSAVEKRAAAPKRPLFDGEPSDKDEAYIINRMTHRGLLATQIEALLGSDRGKTAAVLATKTPSGEKHGRPTYRLRDVAPEIVKPVVSEDDLARMIKTMHYTDLPMVLRKEFWAGQRSKQQYEVAAGDLWPTAKVIEHVGEIYKMVVMAARLTSDAVERQAELSERQRAIIGDQMTGMLKNLEHVIRERFTRPEDADAAEMKPAPRSDDDDL